MKIKLTRCWEERKEKKRIHMQSLTEVDKEGLYTLKVNCKGKKQ